MYPTASKFPLTRRLLLAAAAVSGINASAWAKDGEWPNKPIRLVVNSTAGASTDLVARLVAAQLTKALAQPVVVDNKVGANGLIGADMVAKAPNDGYTLLFAYAASLVVNHTLMPKMPYDLFNDLQPVAQVGVGGPLLVVAGNFPAKNAKEFIAHIKANPDKYNYGSWGIGSGGHLVMEALKMQTGLQINHIPYKGVPPILTDLVGGQISIAFVDPTAAVPFIRAGKIRALASATSSRGPSSPDVPTLTEVGYRFDVDTWSGMFAPTGTPKPLIQRLNAELNRIGMLPEFQARLATLDLHSAPGNTTEQFAQIVRRDAQVWGAIIKDNNIRPE